jgi:SAM-dependent MidA family methyltransferase
MPAHSPLQPHVILANELVDAFPVHIVEKHAETLYEIYIDVRDGRLYEIPREIQNEELASYLDSYKIPWRTYEDGWRAEINLHAMRWIEQATQLLLVSVPSSGSRKSIESSRLPADTPNPNESSENALEPNHKRKRHGFLLTIDYGDTARKLYTADRRHGTLASYFRHQFTEQPLARPGEQDLTAHVNFTALIQAGRQHGLRLHTLTTQRQWLTDLQIYEELEHIRKHEFSILDNARATDEGQIALLKWYNLRQGVMALTARGGMGDFKVLILKH